jgi:D-3-phosphoglycerate dehydrogenase
VSAAKLILIPTFLLHPDAEAVLHEAAGVEVVYGLDEEERAIGLDVIAYDPYFDPIEAERQGVRLVDTLLAALAAADFVSVNTPFNPETCALIGPAELAVMKPTAFLINTARGGVVDTEALEKALIAGCIAGAGLDVTDPEPLPDGHPFFDLDNVVLTPHLGGNASEVFRASSMTPVRLTLDALRGRRPRHLVNPDAWPRHAERFGTTAPAASPGRGDVP